MNRFSDIDILTRRSVPIYDHDVEENISIGKALEEIESYINKLHKYIAVAKRRCPFPSRHGLTHDQSAAIYIYTMEWGETSLNRLLNRALRSKNKNDLDIWYPYLKLFKTALDKLPTVEKVVWRGLPFDTEKLFNKGELVTWLSFSSCSASIDTIDPYLDKNRISTWFLIQVSHGIEVGEYAADPKDEEIILRMGTQFYVSANYLDEISRARVVHLIEIDHNVGRVNRLALNETLLVQNAKPVCTRPKGIDCSSRGAHWSQRGGTVAGGCGVGDGINQLNSPYGLTIDDHENIMVIADWGNHRILQWKIDETKGEVVAGGNGKGSRLNQLSNPTDVLIDRMRDKLIICDHSNQRVVQWSRRSGTKEGEILIENIHCWGLAMDNQGNLYISDPKNHEVRRYTIGNKTGTLVAGGYGSGMGLNQLSFPTFLFVDEQKNIYVSENWNNRVTKWSTNATEGIVLAGNKGTGNNLTQLTHPGAIFIDISGNLFVADSDNNRVMRWSPGTDEGTIVVGGNGVGREANQLHDPEGLVLDCCGNIYVADSNNYRIQRFTIK